MLRMFIGLVLVAAILAGPGCGGANPLPPESNTPDYAKKSADEMKSMYGTPQPKARVGGVRR